MENLFFTVLGVILGWIPPALLWVRDRFTSTKAPGITLAVRPHDRAGVMFQSKIHVDITNQIPGQSVRIAAPYFVFDNGGLLKPYPKWPPEHGTGHFRLYFFSPPTKMHDWPDVYIRPREKTDIWIGVDPQHSDEDIKQAAEAKKIGRLYFQMTRWTEHGSPKTRWVRMKL